MDKEPMKDINNMISTKPISLKTISIPVYRNVLHLGKLLESIFATGYDLTDYKFIFTQDPSPESPIIQEIIYDFCRRFEFAYEIKVNPTSKGVVGNTFEAINTAMEKNPLFNLYFDDDIIVAHDTFKLAEWVYNHVDPGTYAAFCLCNLDNDGEDISKIIRKKGLIGWGFMMTPEQYNKYAKPNWFKPPMWDLSFGRYVESLGDDKFIFPAVSRAKHMGTNGTHVKSKEFNDELQKNMVYNNLILKDINYNFGRI